MFYKNIGCHHLFPQDADLKGHGLIKRDLNLRKMVIEDDKDEGYKVIAKEFGFHQLSHTNIKKVQHYHIL